MSRSIVHFLPGTKSASRKLEEKRVSCLSSLAADKIEVELMAQRQRADNDPLDQQFLTGVLERFAQLQEVASATNSLEELDDLATHGELQAIARAYLCPSNEIHDEGHRAIDNLELWGVPSTSIKKLRERFGKRLASQDESPHDRRGALHSIFVEVDEWSDYIEEYEVTMRKYTLALFWCTVSLTVSSGLCLYFASNYSALLWLAILSAGAAGSSASVIAKMPALDVSLSGELDAYGRRIWSRIAVGTTASLVGCGLLAWGVLPISISNLTFADALASCVVVSTSSQLVSRILFVIAIAMLLGFSERTLASFEQRIFGSGKTTRR